MLMHGCFGWLSGMSKRFFPLRTHRALEQMVGLGARGLLRSRLLQFSNGDDCACGVGVDDVMSIPGARQQLAPFSFCFSKPTFNR